MGGKAAARRLLGAVFVYAFVWAGTTDVARAADDGQETAALAPIFDIDGQIALPGILGFEDAATYRAIFGLQEAGRWQAADREIKKLKDKRLLGYVLAQRYMHPTAYRSKYAELRDWLAEYADHPDADRLHALAKKRQSKGTANPAAPKGSIYNGWAISYGDDGYYRSSKKLGPAATKRKQTVERTVRNRLRKGWPTGAMEILETDEAKRLFDAVEIARIRASVAETYYLNNKDKEALAAADDAAGKGEWASQAHWAGGLAAWRLGDLDGAKRHFEALAQTGRAGRWNRAAGAYWAARVHLVSRNPSQVSIWLRRAAEERHTFYGLLARRALGLPLDFDWQLPNSSSADLAALKADPRGARALALLQIGQRDWAEQELRRIHPGTPEMARAIAVAAVGANLPGLSLRVAGALEADGGERFDSAHFPIPAWQPENGFQVDRALVYAVMRQESAFEPRAVSRAGARGLMQVMPATARFIARLEGLGTIRTSNLFDPEKNMRLGQAYLLHLIEYDGVDGDLFRMMTAYNGGPGNLAKWDRNTRYDGDPLVFIESLPSRETRNYIERVLTYFWIYRDRLGQPTPSLDAIAAGEWPSYTALDGTVGAVANRAKADRVEN
ncbi:MAG: lytic transglycosylase domain-containing protein [Rhodospirillaceae bacterium]|nr:lytic transglycosylase domain-containing protein [Rhodospirillaceae bacterium]